MMNSFVVKDMWCIYKNMQKKTCDLYIAKNLLGKDITCIFWMKQI